MSDEMLESLLDEGRRRLQVTPEELEEARLRRGKLEKALEAEFPGSRTYFNGSIAHDDANTPLNDVDLGVVVSEEKHYGPGKNGPRELMERAREAIKSELKSNYPKLVVTIEGQKRAVLVRFGDPVTAGQDDFTADVIIALDNQSDRGLYIPNLKQRNGNSLVEGWDRADPETHTSLILDAIDDTERMFARTIRLLKHWRDAHGSPLCSWNIKALALESIADKPRTLLEGLDEFFALAAASIAQGLTEDPAGVAGKIQLPKDMTRDSAAWRLRYARDKVREAMEHARNGRPALAQQALHRVLPGVVDESDPERQKAEEAKRLVGSSAALVVASPTVTRAWGA